MYHDLYQIACYQLVCKLFISSFSCPQTIYLGFFAFANNCFFRIFDPPRQKKKNNGPSLSSWLLYDTIEAVAEQKLGRRAYNTQETRMSASLLPGFLKVDRWAPCNFF